jgi:hypothetical protein
MLRPNSVARASAGGLRALGCPCPATSLQRSEPSTSGITNSGPAHVQFCAGVQERTIRPMQGEREDAEQAGRVGAREQRAAERLLVLALLRTDHVERWSQAELETELTGIASQAVETALRGLAAKGLAYAEGGHAWASLSTRALDDLDMICI